MPTTSTPATSLKTRSEAPPSAAAWVEWAMFCNSPSLHLFRVFLKLVPKDDRPRWVPRALELMEGASLEYRIQFLVGYRETARLAQVIDGARREDLVAAGFLYLDPAARQLKRQYPGSAAKAQVAIALNSMRYGTGGRYFALIPLRKARLLYGRAGQTADWDTLLADLLRLHPRARLFQEGLRAIASGKPEDPALAHHRARRSLWARGARKLGV